MTKMWRLLLLLTFYSCVISVRMSKQKRGVQYVQQDEPAFLKRMKQQAGYKEGPTVDTKREELKDHNSDNEHDDEKPQVVVLKSGDLTAEQAKHAEKEVAMKPREVTDEKVVFKKPSKNSDDAEIKNTTQKKSTAKKVKNKSLLSFDDEDEES